MSVGVWRPPDILVLPSLLQEDTLFSTITSIELNQIAISEALLAAKWKGQMFANLRRQIDYL
jgi:hypothetical protein